MKRANEIDRQDKLLLSNLSSDTRTGGHAIGTCLEEPLAYSAPDIF